jgi:methyl-accepting chemotaxis protein
LADEVRKLAERAQEATRGIKAAVDDIHTGLRDTVAVSARGREEVAGEVVRGATAVVTLSQISDMASKTRGAVHEISAATTEQERASGEVAMAMTQVAAASRTQEADAQEWTHEAEMLDSLVGQLRGAVEAFTA